MIIINTFEEIKKINTISEAMKEELKSYVREITEGIVGEAWQSYNLSEVGAIAVIEKADTIEVLNKFRLMHGSKAIPEIQPEFATRVIVGEIEMLKIIWVFGDCNGLSMYYPVGKFSKEFDAWVSDYIME